MASKLSVQNVSFSYKSLGGAIPVLKNVSLEVACGDFVAILGRSGSGKSTLFHLLGCLLKPDSGKILLDGVDLTQLSSDASALIRNEKIGFVFQQFHLLPRATVLDNILLPTIYPVEKVKDEKAHRLRAEALAKQLGIDHRLNQYPNQLSGGEQQRVVIARAMMTDADLILADEPTGNLDTKNAENILEILKELNSRGKTILLITHDAEVASRCKTQHQMVDGKFIDEPSRATQEGDREFVLPPKTSTPPYPKLMKAVAPLALQNLKRNRVRAFLTMIGVTVGIASVFSMLTFGRFAQEKVMKGYEELGSNTLLVYGWGNWKRKATDRITAPFDSFDWDKDVLSLRKIFPEVGMLSPILQAWGNTVNFSGQVIENEVIVTGVNEQMASITRRELLYGRPFSPFHISQRAPVCMIGSDVNERLFRGVPALGKILFISNPERKVGYPCQVIGVFAPSTSNKDWRKPNLDVVLPYTYFQSVSSPWTSNINSFLAQVERGSDIARTAEGIKSFFNQKYLKAGEFNISSDVKLVSQMKKSLGLFTIMLTAIALITLAVGGIGINNMMLVSVTERFKEIGLRKAVGATDKSIRMQFLMESTFLAAIAGVAGVVLGFVSYEAIIYGTSKVVSKLPFEWVFEPVPFFFSVISILVVGIASGIIPAFKAEKLQVIEALRSE